MARVPQEMAATRSATKKVLASVQVHGWAIVVAMRVDAYTLVSLLEENYTKSLAGWSPNENEARRDAVLQQLWG